MPIADRKKVQTLINVAGQQALLIRKAVDALKTARTAFLLQNPDITGTPLAGNLAAIAASLSAVDTEIAKPIWSTLIAAIVPTHQNKALD